MFFILTRYLTAVVVRLRIAESLVGLVRVEIAGPDPTVSDSVGLDSSWRIYILSKLPGNVDSSALGTPHGNGYLRTTFLNLGR